MVKKVDISLEWAYRLLHPSLTVLASCTDSSGKINIITLAWAMPVSLKPPLIVVSIAPKRHSHKLIEETEEFVINIPTMDIVKKVLYCGKVSGRKADKFKEANLTPLPAKRVRSPIINECIGHLECNLYKKVPAGDHTLFIGRIVAAYVNEGTFTGTFDTKKVKLIYHLGGDKFTTTSGEVIVP
ncbi:TPA: flavin reductase family protein [Candidatus Bathyarchaeota archaeon]|nr:flavin reductase family protein [Candidatus Bathyarchaeota archaeon]